MRNSTPLQGNALFLRPVYLFLLFLPTFLSAINPSGRLDHDLVLEGEAISPEAICAEVVELDLPENGFLFINAIDFDMGSYDNVTSSTDLHFSFSMDIEDTDKVLVCDDLGAVSLEVFVFDNDGLFDNCSVELVLTNSLGVNCDGLSVAFGGKVETEYGAAIEEVELYASSIMQFDKTDEEGDYSFDIPIDDSGSITASLSSSISEGVTTYDIVKIIHHILGIDFLDSPYKIIAADVNNSSSVTTMDIVMLRMVILQMSTNFFNNTSWRFVDADYVFPDPLFPWGFPELINYSELSEDVTDVDFIAIKVGDVTEDAGLHLFEDRIVGDEISIRGRVEEHSGNLKVCSFLVNDSFLSGQFTLDFDPTVIEVLEINDGLFSTRNISANNLAEGHILFSWNGDLRDREDIGDIELFSIVYRETIFSSTDAPFKLSSSVLEEEFMATDHKESSAKLFFDNTVADSFLTGISISPNPASESSQLLFSTKEEGNGTLYIYNCFGDVILKKNLIYSQGVNTVDLQLASFSGAYHCQLKLLDRVYTVTGLKI